MTDKPTDKIDAAALMKWIDLSKREPPVNGNKGHVLVYLRMPSGNYWDRCHTTIALPRRKRGKLVWFFSHTLGPWAAKYITHWQPLPSEPNDSITGGGTPYRGCTGSVGD